MEDQPLPADASPTALSPGYIADFDPEEDEEDPEEDPADHPVDRGDNDDNESSDDDDDDDDVVKDEEDEEEEEHLARPTLLLYLYMILSPQAKDTEAFKIDESASTPPTSPHHIIFFSKTKSHTETMTTVNQGMSVKEIERVIAQRVANAIEAIAIYKAKTNMARQSMSQTERQEDKVAENASNKRKWEGNRIGSLSQQNKGHKVPRAHTTRLISKKSYAGSLPLCNQCKFHHNGPCTIKCGNCKKVGHIIQNCKTPATTRNQRTHTYYECGSLRHYKCECPIVKFQKHVDMIHGEGTGRRNITVDLSRCVLNATITMMVHVLPDATSATELAIWPVIIGVLQMPILLTTKGALGQVRRLLAMNVGIKGTTRMTARSERTKTMKTKLEVLEHVEWCMTLEEEKPNKTLTTLRMRSTLKRESCLAFLVNPKLELF
ncbi:reverse transcriptase domain-containing protein [Tanacetum coccineum]